jgi:hypothetical protein
MVAGMTVGSESFIFTTTADDILEDSALKYETIILDKANDTSTSDAAAPTFSIAPTVIGRQIALGAAARSDVRRTGAARYQPATEKNSQVAKSWTVVSTMDQSRQAIPGVDPTKTGSYAVSFQALDQLKKVDPARAKTLMLLRV